MAGGDYEARWRKVTGAKVFASDFRPSDLSAQGWPPDCAHALILRARYVDRAYLGLDLHRLPRELRPQMVITADDLPEPPYLNRISSDRVQALVPTGDVADFVGQPVAIAIFEDFVRFRR